MLELKACFWVMYWFNVLKINLQWTRPFTTSFKLVSGNQSNTYSSMTECGPNCGEVFCGCVLRMKMKIYLVFMCVTVTIRFFRYREMRRTFKNLSVSSCSLDHSSLKVLLFVFFPFREPSAILCQLSKQWQCVCLWAWPHLWGCQ